ncbi:MAG: hypothetical protein ABS34_10955 [Opitutaceae bacterium BACL24 MAG-120322-bin51]|nr:MAG: hypothetical protein ABS34_10955 [Opitutaceae bacterium BACL24 MAG-120322-bin51]
MAKGIHCVHALKRHNSDLASFETMPSAFANPKIPATSFSKRLLAAAGSFLFARGSNKISRWSTECLPEQALRTEPIRTPHVLARQAGTVPIRGLQVVIVVVERPTA